MRELVRRRTLAEVCALLDPLDPGCEGVLYGSQAPAQDHDEDDARFAAAHGLGVEHHRRWIAARRLRNEGRLWLVSGDPLSSESVAPFHLDGRAYRSVWCFYQSLKFAAGDPRRAAAAAGTGGRCRGGGRRAFIYEGEEIAVGSTTHGVLVARATEAKVRAHEHVRRALAATGTSRLFMGHANSQVLGRFMPFALMVLRFKLFP